jgi:hypothetical protein
MTRRFQIESLDDNQAYLVDSDGQRLLLPRKFFSAKAIIGDQVLISVNENRDLAMDNKELAQEILNEILHL